VSGAPVRTPWGFWHIVAIVLLTAAGWLILVTPVAIAVLLHNPRRMLTFGAGIGLTALLYVVLYGAILVVVRRVGGWRALGYRFPGWATLLAVIAFVPVWFGILQVAGLVTEYALNQGKPIPSNVTELFGPNGLRGIGPAQIALAIVVVAVLVPIVEETLFRGVLYQWLRGHLGVGPAAILSALVFAAAHLLSVGLALWKLLPVLFLMGCLLALTFQRTRSLYASMVLHGANNAVAIALAVRLGLGT
jgi:membrane protease YdiL (CAAX protease family)